MFLLHGVDERGHVVVQKRGDAGQVTGDGGAVVRLPD